jgi:hypothetical protein
MLTATELAREHHFKRIVEQNEHLAQGAVDRTYTEIKHGLDCRLRLLQQNLNFLISYLLA